MTNADARKGPEHGSPARAPSRLPLLLFVGLVFGLVAFGCDGGGGPNTRRSFRAVLIEPSPGSIGLGCGNGAVCMDTIRITFNNPIDTTAVLDDERPRYFLASLAPSGFILDSLGTTVTNDMRTLVIPFTFSRNVAYDFALLDARDTDGNPLETTASTSFETGNCTTPCP